MVVHDAGSLDAETCLNLVRETSLTECTFLEPSDVADVKVRYFLADREAGFAGHPTIASVIAWLNETGQDLDCLTLETKSGLIPIEVDEGRVSFSLSDPQFGAQLEPTEVAQVFDLKADDIVGMPQIVSVGLGHTITMVRSLDALKRARFDRPKLQEFCHRFAEPGLADAPAPYLVALEGVERGDTFGRLFLEAGNNTEDAFTGSATAETAAYLWRHGLIKGREYVAEQGHWMGRPGHANVRITGDREAIEAVEVVGSGHILMRGELTL